MYYDYENILQLNKNKYNFTIFYSDKIHFNIFQIFI